MIIKPYIFIGSCGYQIAAVFRKIHYYTGVSLVACCNFSVKIIYYPFVPSFFHKLTLIIIHFHGGGAGNRTRVRKYYVQASTCLSYLFFNLRTRDAGKKAPLTPIPLSLF